MSKFQKNILFSVMALVIFAIIALVYHSPVISGNQSISQPDIVNYKGSAQEMQQFREKTGNETYWSDAMFGGMPTYQTGAQYPNHWIKKIDETIRFLPRPADYMFIMFAGFFVLGIVLFRNWKYAFLGACLFAMGTYFFQLYEAGHNSKVHAIAYFAPLTAGVLLLYRKKYILGFLMTAFFMALELVANHPQMTYYLGLGLLIYVIIEGIESFKKGEVKSFVISSALALFAVILGLGMNATGAITSYEYGEASTRGKNDISLIEGKNQNGLDKDYITHWSYGKLETLNLFIPNFMGGGSAEPDTYKENLKESLTKAQSQEEYQYFSRAINYISTYWGDQPFTSGPAYQGAVVILLFFLGMFFVKGKYKWWLVAATIMSILLAWGKNMMWLTDLFIDYFPMYSKFRAVSSILVIAEFTMPLLAVWGVYKFFNDKELTQEYKKKILTYVGGGVVAFIVLLLIAGGGLFDFSTDFEKQFPAYIQEGIRADRISMFRSDAIRTLIFVILSLALLAGYVYEKIKMKEIVIIGLAVLTLVDLWGVDRRYLNDDNYIPKQYVDYPFPTEMTERLYNEAQANPSLMQVAYRVDKNRVLADLKKQDTSRFRLFDAEGSTFNDASTSYFVNSIGGYHGAKMQNFQNIIDIYLSRDSVIEKRLGVEQKGQNILDMMNTKYFLVTGQNGSEIIQNPGALGNAWFVEEVKAVKDPNQAILDIAKIDLSKQAVANWAQDKTYQVDSTSQIQLVDHAPNRLVYKSNNKNDGFAVFSEIYYDKGWQASIDGKKVDIIKTNYFVRGLEIPKGQHEIELKFDPQSVKTGSLITLSSNIIFILLLIGGVYWMWRNKDEKQFGEEK